MRSTPSLIVVVGLPLVVLAQGGGWRANPDIVAREAARRPDTNYEESRVPPYTLPDLLAGGSRAIASRRNGRRVARQILDLFRDNVYGRSPAPPEHLAFTVLEENPRAMDGAATLRRIAIVSRQGQRSHRIRADAVPAEHAAPRPVFLLINNRPVSHTDPTRAEKSGFWPAEQLIARGYGMATFHYGHFAPDDKDTFRDGVMTLFDGGGSGKPPAYTWGALAAWAWGASRAWTIW